jgi:hypothetical protein
MKLKFFTIAQEYNYYPTVKISPQLEHKIYGYELNPKTHRSTATAKTLN